MSGITLPGVGLLTLFAKVFLPICALCIIFTPNHPFWPSRILTTTSGHRKLSSACVSLLGRTVVLLPFSDADVCFRGLSDPLFRMFSEAYYAGEGFFLGQNYDRWLAAMVADSSSQDRRRGKHHTSQVYVLILVYLGTYFRCGHYKLANPSMVSFGSCRPGHTLDAEVASRTKLQVVLRQVDPRLFNGGFSVACSCQATGFLPLLAIKPQYNPPPRCI